jgi:hypothetical protein
MSLIRQSFTRLSFCFQGFMQAEVSPKRSSSYLDFSSVKETMRFIYDDVFMISVLYILAVNCTAPRKNESAIALSPSKLTKSRCCMCLPLQRTTFQIKPEDTLLLVLIRRKRGYYGNAQSSSTFSVIFFMKILRARSFIPGSWRNIFYSF